MGRFAQNDLAISPLEQFVRDYVDAREGVWDEIEPQVYDLLIGPEIVQVAFDPEALHEHPLAQLASPGSPLLDRLLGDAAERWSSVRLYRTGLNLHPHDLESRLRRAISLSADTTADIQRVRVMDFPQGIFWFKATFSSDQKEEELLPVGMDLHYQREVRHLEPLLSSGLLSPYSDISLPEAPHAGLVAGYRAGRGHAARTVAALANSRRRQWAGAIEKQIARMSAYYARLREEVGEQAARGADPAAVAARTVERREAIDREERLRIAELRQKSAIQVRIKLVSFMVVHQPKLLIVVNIRTKSGLSAPLEAVWDPLTDNIEPIPCPGCGRPTFAFRLDRGGLGCSSCPPVRHATRAQR